MPEKVPAAATSSSDRAVTNSGSAVFWRRSSPRVEVIERTAHLNASPPTTGESPTRRSRSATAVPVWTATPPRSGWRSGGDTASLQVGPQPGHRQRGRLLLRRLEPLGATVMRGRRPASRSQAPTPSCRSPTRSRAHHQDVVDVSPRAGDGQVVKHSRPTTGGRRRSRECSRYATRSLTDPGCGGVSGPRCVVETTTGDPERPPARLKGAHASQVCGNPDPGWRSPRTGVFVTDTAADRSVTRQAGLRSRRLPRAPLLLCSEIRTARKSPSIEERVRDQPHRSLGRLCS